MASPTASTSAWSCRSSASSSMRACSQASTAWPLRTIRRSTPSRVAIQLLIATLEGVDRRIVRSGQAVDACEHARIELDADERHDHADVEAVGDAIAGKDRRGVADEVDGQPGFDQVA